MGIDKLSRVCWRLRRSKDSYDGNDYTFSDKELKRAIMFEIGTSPFTIRYNKKLLKELEWIEWVDSSRWRLTGADLTES